MKTGVQGRREQESERRRNGMEDFVREFLFGEAGIVRDEAGVRSEIVMDLRTEGWIGIPHGGISMGAIADLFESLHEARSARGLPYPVTMNMRMGGSRLRTGETVHVAVAPEGEGAKGIVIGTRKRDALPRGGHHEGIRAGDIGGPSMSAVVF